MLKRSETVLKFDSSQYQKDRFYRRPKNNYMGSFSRVPVISAVVSGVSGWKTEG